MTADVLPNLKNWSITATSNQPDYTDVIGPNNLADNIRTVQSVTRYMHDSGTIASAATTDLGTIESEYIDITGTTTITSFGTVSAGIRKKVKFSGVLTLTHNATSLILPRGVSYTTVAGDTAEFLSLGSGNWRCLWWQDTGGNVKVTGDTISALTITGALTGSSATLSSTLGVTGATTFSGAVTSSADIKVTGSAAFEEARSVITQNATTMDLWALANIIDGTGAAVTITNIANAPQSGMRRMFYPVAGTIITHGGVFDVDSLASVTAAAGDCWEIIALSTTTYRVQVHLKSGRALVDDFTTAATQAEMEAETSTTVYVTPGRQYFHPSACKAWCKITYTAGVPGLTGNYNVASLTDNGVGDVSLNFTRAFSDANYSFAGACTLSGSVFYVPQGLSQSTTALRLGFPVGSAGTLTDPTTATVACFGDFP